MFQNVKVGDSLFVVRQKRRGAADPDPGYWTVVSVGKKYMYLSDGVYNKRQPFHKDTGHSAHTNDNARANGLGMNAYRSESHWRYETDAITEHARLRRRICDTFGGLVAIPADCVAAIHALLDTAGLPNKIDSNS